MRTIIFCFLFVNSVFCLRNPFYSRYVDEKKLENMRLLGTLKCDGNYSGIIKCNKTTYVVFNGAKINDCYINNIGDKTAVVSFQGLTKELVIQ